MSGWYRPIAVGGGVQVAPPAAVDDQSWRERSACNGKATRDYDPWDAPDTAYYPPEAAATICDSCPVRRECLVDALWRGDWCVRGGLTARQRDALLRPRRRSRCPVCRTPLPVAVPAGSDDDTPVQICVVCGISWRTVRKKKTSDATIAPVGG
jgi:hypothetical protein